MIRGQSFMKSYYEKAMTYAEYISLIDNLADEGKSTGEQTEDRVYFTKLNRQRMKRLNKTVVISDELKNKVRNLKSKLIWLILTESWCGDAAQNLPVIEKIAAESEMIETRYLLRDENPELMDQFLTNGGRAIPILICVDAETFTPTGHWGSRPKAIQEYFLELKASGMEKGEMMELVQRRYNLDKEKSIQDDFTRLIESCLERTNTAGAK